MIFLDSACGDILSTQTTNFIASLIKAIKYLVPILLIIMGSLDFVKATYAQKDDELNNAKTKLIQKIIAGVAVFFVFTLVTWIVKLLNENFGIQSLSCVNSFLNGSYSGSNEEIIDYCSQHSNNDTAYQQCLKSKGYNPTTSTTTKTTRTTSYTYKEPDTCKDRESYHKQVETCNDVYKQTKEEYKNTNDFTTCITDFRLNDPINFFKSEEKLLDDCYNWKVESAKRVCISEAEKSFCND